MGVITGILLSTYTLLLGTLAMTSQFLMLKKIMSTILHHNTFFFTENLEFLPGSTKYFHVLARVFVISDIREFMIGQQTNDANYLKTKTNMAGVGTNKTLLLDAYCSKRINDTEFI